MGRFMRVPRSCHPLPLYMIGTEQQLPDVIILCGGRGERVKGIHPGIPKPLFPVRGKPFLDYVLAYFVSQGLRRFILSIGYLGNGIRQYYVSHRYAPLITFSDEGNRQLGTAGALKLAQKQIRTAHIVVANGDSLCTVDCRGLIAAHEKNRAEATIAVAPSFRRGDAGNITTNRRKRIMSFMEKTGKTRHVNAGVYAVQKTVLSMIPAGKPYSLEYDLFPGLVEERSLYGFPTDSAVYDIGTPERYRQITGTDFTNSAERQNL